MGQTRKRVGLVHELGQLTGTEELLDRSNHGANVDQSLRRNGLNILGGHPFTNNALHTRKTGTDLILDQFANGTKATITKVVNVIGLDTDRTSGSFHFSFASVQTHDVLDN
ncbi:unannotated protein [freshwater metagenome]|uniref:Unannotated protein n=1 Tax=freshwater metagenome TaxID=449393 RepID=A0A6J7E5R6_9ZZZZ